MISKQKIMIDIDLFIENFKSGEHHYEVIRDPVPEDAVVKDIKIEGKVLHIYYEFNLPDEICPTTKKLN